MNIPEGWKLVPIEPTEEMINEGVSAFGGVYRAMIEAAPTPPDQSYDKVMADYNEPAMESSWQYLKTQLSSKDWTTGEAFTYRGFFAWGWEARRQYGMPAQDEPVAYRLTTYDGISIIVTDNEPRPNIKITEPLYTRHQSNKLRKAAEEVARRYAQVIAIGAPAGLVEAVRNLHSVLEEK